MFKTINNLLYIYQLSEYDNGFFLNWLANHPDLKNYLKSKKENPVWTAKAKIIFAVSLVFLPLYFILPPKPSAYFLILAASLIKPLESIAVFFIVQKTKFRLKKHENLIKIGIAGSYGKTTTKEYLAEILSVKHRVLKSPGNVNTLLGLARFISKKLDESFRVLIVEMAAYRKGDIKKLCRLIQPEIRILTGIADSHLERFGSPENIVEAKFEIADGAQEQKNSIFLNADDRSILENYRKFLNIRPEFYGINSGIEKVFEAKNIKVSEKGLKFDIVKNGSFYFNADVELFGKHQLEPILVAISVADKLGFSREEILAGLKNIKPLPRRLCLTKAANGIIVIDDSYNISKASADAALDFLKEAFPKKRKVVISAGLVEQGTKKSENNRWFGKKMKTAGNLLLLVKNSNTRFIVEEMNLSEEEILEYNKKINTSEIAERKTVIFENAEELNLFLPAILKPNDALLIFPYDLPAHYY